MLPHRKAKLPHVYKTFSDYWRLSNVVANDLWHALEAAQRSRPQALLGTFLFHSVSPVGDKRALIHQTLRPQEVIEALEEMVREGCLPRWEANIITHKILRRVTANGEWW